MHDTKPRPIGHGDFCSGGLWIIDTARACPICGADEQGPCNADPGEREATPIRQPAKLPE